MTTTEAVVVELPKDEKETPAMGGGGMGGMDYWGLRHPNPYSPSKNIIIFCPHKNWETYQG